MLRILCLSLALAGILRADDSDFQPGDALYAPEEETATAEAAAPLATSASYYSTAHIDVIDLAHDKRAIEGVELFADGQYLGKSPLDLAGFLVSKPSISLSARLAGYHESLRPAIRIPAEGSLNIAMIGDNAAGWYTTPSFIAGLLMMGGAVAAYAQNNSSSSTVGASLVIGGVAVIGISQAVARLFHIPSLDKDVEAYNARPEPKP